VREAVTLILEQDPKDLGFVFFKNVLAILFLIGVLLVVSEAVIDFPIDVKYICRVLGTSFV